jgi:peptidoglycan/LPS O-acetylase OafA/YrhL
VKAFEKANITPGLSFVLDAVRGIAALLVVMQHATKEFFGRFSEQPEGTVGFVGKLFFLGSGFGREAVLCFFVMSGLLIGPKFLSGSKLNAIYLKSYSLDRLVRIWVVAIPALVLSMIGAYSAQFLFSYSNSYLTDDCSPSIIDFLSAVFFLNKVAVPTICSNGPFWSIHNEVFYYFLWPFLIIAFFAPSRGLRVFSMAASVAMVTLLTLFDPWDPNNTLILFPVWCFGALCLYLPRLSGPVFLYVGGLALVMLYPQLIPGEGLWVVDSLVLSFAIGLLFRRCVDCAPPAPWVAKTAKHFADISFSLYLTHVILLNFVVTATWDGPGGHTFDKLSLESLLGWAGYVILAILFAEIFYWAFESRTKRVREFVRKFSKSDALSRRNTKAH